MKELVFQVELKSDIVLPASSNTEGKINQLDFIAGSNFLGMVAKNYDKFASSFDVFHTGKVRFGDGHILKDGKMTYKMPLSIFKEKTDENILVNQLHTSLDTLKQAQQLRNGYITKDLEQVLLDYTYSQKSARDKEKRTSKEGKMYGYTALKKGSVWQFVVKVDETISNEDKNLIINTLQESKRLGKSKSAEYGEVKITYLENQSRENINDKNPKLDEVVLYCNSRLALVDDNGNPTYDLKYLCDGVKIVYEKTQIRISTFTPYNGARKTKDYERVCINKGSVIVIKNPTKSQLETIQKGVGAFLSEGFGEILINPSFLMEQKFELKKYEKKKEKEKVAITEDVVKFLAQREKTKNEMLDIAKEVAKFIEDHKKPTFSNIKSSQWGNIRSIATSNQKNWLNNIEEYVSSGAKKWEVQQSTTLLNAINTHTIDQQKFTKLLAMKMGGKND
jgi:hypothetical protein